MNGWLGDLPSWITTGAVVLAAGQYWLERQRRTADRIREERAQASHLIAWTVGDVDATPKVYGAIIANASQSTFHDVVLRMRLHGRDNVAAVRLDILPPGRYFVRKQSSRGDYDWDFPIPADSYPGTLRPYMNTEDYSVRSLEFSDSLRQSWVTDEHAVLRRVM